MLDYRIVVRPQCKIPSVNCAYKPRASGRKVWMYMDPDVGDYKTQIYELVQNSKLMELKQYKDKIRYLRLSLVMYIHDSFWVRDTSNMVKITEDAIAEAIGIDDRFTLSVLSTKVKSPSAQEAVGIRIRAYLQDEDENALSANT